MADLNFADLQGLLSFTPTEDERRRAQTMGLLTAGLGILGANATLPRGAGFGGAIAGAAPGVAAYQQMMHQAPKERLSNLSTVVGLNKLQRDMKAQDMLTRMYAPSASGGAGAPRQDALAQGAAVGDIGPTVTNAARIPAAQAQPMPNFGAMIAASIPAETVKALMEDWRLRNPELDFSGPLPRDKRTAQIVPGAPAMPQTNQQGFSTTPRFNPATGRIEIDVTPGAAEAYGTQQDIHQRTTARYGAPVTLQPPGGGAARAMTPLQFSDLMHGGPAPAQPPAQPPRAPAGMQIPPDVQAQRDAEAAAIRAREVNGGGIPTAAVVGPGVPVQSEAQRVAATEQAKTDAERAAARPTAQLAYQNSIDNLDRFAAEASALLTSPGAGRITGVVGAFPDVPGSKAADARARLETLKSQTGFNLLQAMRDASKTGGALGNVSEKELAYLQNNLAALQTSQSEDQFKKSLRQIIDYAQRAKERLTQAFQSTYATPGQGAQQPPMRRREDILNAADAIIGAR